jgi:DNA invertase Pin-like site-specific DNA recombinase
MERKKFQQLLNMIEEGANAPPMFDAVLVFTIDRLTRN